MNAKGKNGRSALAAKGFTVVEIVVVSVIFVLVIVMIYNLLFFRAKSEAEMDSSLDLYKNARFALTKLVRELQEGREVLSPTGGAPAEKHVIFVNNCDDVIVYRYRSDQKKLYRAQVDEATGMATGETEFASGVEDCSFVVRGSFNKMVEVFLRFGTTAKGFSRTESTKTYDITTSVYMRNF